MMRRWVLASRPCNRPNTKQVLETLAMREWSLPGYGRFRDELSASWIVMGGSEPSSWTNLTHTGEVMRLL